MLNLDTRIPLMAQERDYGRGFDMMQQAQMNQLKLQTLRDEYNAAKEERDRKKAMRQGMASELQKMQQGTPAQYRTTFPQTIPTGQMPQGMTGVLASERGQNLPQPALFGENILQGNFDVNRELVSPAIAPKQPDLKDYLEIRMKQAFVHGDEKGLFEAAKLLKELEKNPNKYFGGLTKAVDTKTNKPLFLAMTETGVSPVDGYQPYEEPKEQKAPITWKVGKGRTEETWGYDAKGNQVLLGVQSLDAPRVEKPDPVTQALEIERGKEKIKQESTTKAAQREKLANANDGLLLLDNYINALKESPQSGASELYQKGMGFIGNPLFLGDEKQQGAMARAKQAGEALLTFAQKQPGPSTDRDVASYRAQMGVVTDTSLPAPARVAAAEQAKSLLLKIQEKYGNYQDAQPSPTTINHGDTLSKLPTTAPKGAVAKNAQTGKPEFIFNGTKWIPVGSAK